MKIGGALQSGVRLVIVSGIPAGDSGTGRFVAHLQSRLAKVENINVRVISKPERPPLWRVRLWWREKAVKEFVRAATTYGFCFAKFWAAVTIVRFRRRQRIILLHPQNLGYKLALKLFESRIEPSLLYLLDSSFFCILSYNHLPGGNEACLECIDLGFHARERNHCKPFPRADPDAAAFAPRLKELINTGRVRPLAQNRLQAELAKRHFKLTQLPITIGLWTNDWDEAFAGARESHFADDAATNSWDVVFHGHCLDAKGARWTADLAKECPELRFMFPFARPAWFEAPDNCAFVPCSWESGLAVEIRKSKFVAVPSLWSAPIEGALVKSIACGSAVIVVDNPTSYCNELPDGLVLKLPASQSAAGLVLREAIKANWRPNEALKAKWIREFTRMKDRFVQRLLDAAI